MTREEQIAFYSRPIDIHDVLWGINYAVAFNAKGRQVGRPRWAARCLRTLQAVARSQGNTPRADGAVEFDPLRRALQERTLRMLDVVGRHCDMCPQKQRGDCVGVERPK
jgi:hypothetical protein